MSEEMVRRSRSPRSRAMDRAMLITLIRSNLESDRSRLAEKKEEARREKEEGWVPPRRCVGWVTEEEANKEKEQLQRMRPEHIARRKVEVCTREETLQKVWEQQMRDPWGRRLEREMEREERYGSSARVHEGLVVPPSP